MDWGRWKPQERATLCFVTQEDRILLIRKQRGLGAGKINGPGGRLEPGESFLASAVRETEEELCITPTGLERRGHLHFQFTDGYSLLCVVYTASAYHGTPTATEEAIPIWTPLDAIPYHEMWEDDRHWLPGMLAGKNFLGYFHFHGDQMLSHQIDWLPALPDLPSHPQTPPRK